MRSFWSFVWCFLTTWVAIGQDPVADFSVPASICQGQNLSIVDNATNASSYLWDFCFDALENESAEVEVFATITESAVPEGIEVIKDLGNWYGFISSRNNNKLLRLDFGTSLTATPTITDLGNPGSLLKGPKNIKFIKEGGNWYGIVVNYSDGKLLRLFFGTSLANTPTATDLGNLSSWSLARGLDLVVDGTDIVVAVSSSGSNKVSLVNFGNSITNNPTAPDVTDILTSSLLVSQPNGIALIEDGGNWYGLLSSKGNQKLLHLDFGATLLSEPTETDMGTITRPTELSLVRDGLNFYGIVSSETLGFYRVAFGADIDTPGTATVQNFGDGGVLNFPFSLALVKDGANWQAFTVGTSGGKMNRIAFTDACTDVSPTFSTDAQPNSPAYTGSGDKAIEQQVISANGNIDRTTKFFTINAATAPDIDFTTDNACILNQNAFNGISSGNITNWSWDFGDTNNAIGQNANHQYGSIGAYEVTLVVNDMNGCNNAITKTVNIYNQPPTPTFSFPGGGICTNAEIQFDNLTNEAGFDSAIEWSWDFNGEGASTDKEPAFTFTTSGLKDIDLAAEITGCVSVATTQQINIQVGPVVDFDYSNNCFGEAIQFENLTTGTGITGYTWDFDDGQMSNDEDPTNTYASAATYSVELTVTNNLGCSTTYSEDVIVNDQDLADFTNDSFEEGVSAGFQGLDLTLAGDQVVAWSWDFDGLGTANVQNPSFTFNVANTYNVVLDVTTEQGCNFQIDKDVVVAPAEFPTVDFSIPTTLCQNENLIIENNSVNAQNYLWDFCFDGLNNPGTEVEVLAALANSSVPEGIEVVHDVGNWYAFVCSRANNKLFRLDFGSDLNSTPSVTDLGNPNSVFNGPKNLKFRKEDGNWRAILANYNNGSLVRLDFGGDITSTPTGTDLTNLGGWNLIRGIDLVEDGGDVMVAVSSSGNNFISLVNFGNSLANVPVPATDILDILESEVNLSQPNGISLVNNGADWYGLVASKGNQKLLHLDFGSNLWSEPTVTDMGTITRPTELSFVQDGHDFYGIVSSETAGFYRVEFGDVPDNPGSASIDNFGNAGVLSFPFALALVKDGINWVGFTIGTADGKVNRIPFTDACTDVTPTSSTDAVPASIVFQGTGTRSMELIGYSSNGNFRRVVKSLTISGNQAPDIDFTTDNACLTAMNSFSGISTGNIANWSWDFGDGNVDNGQNVTHQYLATGSFMVSLTITDVAGCSNNLTREVNIYAGPPAPDFSFPGAGTCSNAPIAFNNLTDVSGYDPDDLIYEWDFNGEGSSNDRNPSFIFLTTGAKDISLKVSIPGCEGTPLVKQVTVALGPTVAFDYTNNCFGEAIQFDNQTTGTDISGYNWDFGDTNTSTDTDPTHTYASAATYTTSLTTTTTTGCISTVTLDIPVNDQPLADFTFGDFTENVEGAFTASDLTLSDDNVVGWNWDFGGIGSSTEQNPLFSFPNPDTYDVSLAVSTDQGCNFEVQKSVNVVAVDFPTVDFQIPATICLDENLLIDDQSINVQDYLWDFCFDGLRNESATIEVGTVSEANVPEGLEMVYSKGNYYGFVSSRSNNKLLRLDFGDDPTSTPVLTDLGDIGGLLNAPKNVKFILEGGNWYGLMANYGDSHLIRLTFGSSLTNTPVGEDLGNLNGWVILRGIDLVKDEVSGDIIAVVSSTNSDLLTLVNFGNSITNDPDPVTDVLDILASEPLLSRPNGVSLIQDNGSWFGVVASNANNKVLHLSFGSNLFSQPMVSDLGTVSRPTELSLIKDGPEYFAFVSTQSAGFYRIDFGTSISSTAEVVVEEFGDASLIGGAFSQDFVRERELWRLFAIGTANNVITRVDFTDTCDELEANTSTLPEPTGFSFDESGTRMVELSGYSSNGNVVRLVQEFTVSSSQAPPVSFTTDNACIIQENNFSGESVGSIVTWSWNFGDGNIAQGQQATHQYAATGSYNVSLTVENDVGCTNTEIQNVVIYDQPPTPDFQVPTGLSCSNSEITFTNLTDETGFGPNDLNYTWDFDGLGTSTDKDGTFNFSSGGLKQISLVVEVPGCSQFVSKSVLIEEGPGAAFSFDNACLEETVQFNNLTTGDGLTSFAWDFGDGNTSIQESPAHIFTTFGTFEISLTVTNSLGCQSTAVQSITITDLPLVDFSNELACSGSPVQFFDETTVTGANITAWRWTVTGNSILDNGEPIIYEEQNPQILFEGSGQFDVDLEAFTNFGCSASLSKTVEVLPGPQTDFAIEVGCLNEASQLLDLTPNEADNPNVGWLWSVEDVLYFEPNPTHVFTEAGEFQLSLQVTADNRCVTTETQTVVIPDLPTPDFTFSVACDNEDAIFVDTSISPNDPVVSREWDFGGLGSANGPSAAFKFSQPGNYNVSLIVTTENGCDAFIGKTVTINQSPEAGFNLSTDEGSPPLVVTTQNTSTNASRYEWYINQFGSVVSEEENPSFTFTDEGEFEVYLVAINDLGCSDTTNQLIDVFIPDVDLEIVGINSADNNGTTNIVVEILNSGSIAVNGVELLITLDNETTISESIDQVLNSGDRLIHTLNFALVQGLNSTELICVEVKSENSPIEETNIVNNKGCISFEPKMVVEAPFPNPASDRVNIGIILPEPDLVTITLINSGGKVVLQNEYASVQKGLNSFLLDMAAINQGIYLLRIIYGDQQETRRIFKN